MPDYREIVILGTTTLRTGSEIAAAGLIPEGTAEDIDAVRATYSVAIPDRVAALVDPSDPADPIARQFVPDIRELEAAEDELADPIGDEAHSPVPGLVHRYPDRVLLMPTLSCPVYCRYCFRRDRVGRAEGAPSAEDMETAFAYIAENPQIKEVILTGGDPLSLSDRKLGDLLSRLSEFSHLNNLRIHTRVPVVMPDRVTEGLVGVLTTRLPVWMVLHTNHPRELTKDVADVCNRLVRGSVPLLSQSVLLKGVNDNVDTLTALFRRLVELRVKPYYLHHPDRARGTARFRLTLEEGRELVEKLRGNISGLCQPTYVVDIPGGYGKTPIAPADQSVDGSNWSLRNFQGNSHIYADR